MSLLSNLSGQLPDRDRILLLLSIGIIAAMLIGYGLFIAIGIIPHVQSWQEASSQLDAAERALAKAEKSDTGSPADVTKRIDTAQAKLSDAISAFLSESQAAEALNRLYQYADESDVVVVDLRTGPGPKGDELGLYDVRVFGLQVEGTLPHLVRFVSQIREVTLDGFVIDNVNIAEKECSYTLTLDITLYTSALAVDAGLSPMPIATPLPTPTNVPIAAPSPTVTPVTVPSPSPSPTLPPQTQDVVHIVIHGDTLYSIASRYDTTVTAIMVANGLDSSAINVGQALRIPTD